MATIGGTSGNDILTGTDFGDYIYGYAGSDTLRGNGGSDYLEGGAGADIIDGGPHYVDGGGNVYPDVAMYGSSSAGVEVDLQTGAGHGGDAEGDVLIQIEGLYGSGFNDVLFGDAGVNTLIGYGGDDVLDGRDGNDYLNGAEGDDRLFGGAGNDFLRGDTGSNWFEGGEGTDTLEGNSETFGDTASYSGAVVGAVVDLAAGTDASGDTLRWIDSLDGSNLGDTLRGNVGANTLAGNSGDDLLDGRAGDDNLRGGAGDDSLVGGAGADRLEGGEGQDSASYAASTAAVAVDLLAQTAAGGDAAGDTLASIEDLFGSSSADTLRGNGAGNVLVGNGGDDTLRGEDGDDTLTGGDGDDTLYGGNGADVLRGNAGSNWLEGGAGADDLYGNPDAGAARDRASYAASLQGVTVDLASGTGSGGDAQGDRLYGIESLDGSEHSDTLSGEAGDNSLIGNDGDDTLSGRDGNDDLEGGGGNDRLFGGAGNDRLRGDIGSNWFEGGAGSDTLEGSSGSLSDTASYAGSTAAVVVDLTADTAAGGDASGDTLTLIDSLDGSGHGDTLRGNVGANTIAGNGGDDMLDARAGDDDLRGGSGDDSLVGGAGADRLEGGEGQDSASYAASTAAVAVDLLAQTAAGGDAAGDTLAGIEDLFGSSSADTLRGNGAGNVLVGNGGDDTLRGEDGDDTLTGGDGDDTLYGGNGADTLLGNAGSNWLEGGAGADNLYGNPDAGAARDRASYAASLQGVTVDLASGTGSGGDAQGDRLYGIESLDGSEHGDALSGDAGDNSLVGNGGDDTLSGRAGADAMDGGQGSDLASYASSMTGVTVDLATGTGTGGDAAGDTLASIERLLGSAGADVLRGDLFDNALEGSAGNDALEGGDGDDTLAGGAGDDAVAGGAGRDTAVFDGMRSDFSVVRTGTDAARVTDLRSGAVDVLTRLEVMRFDDPSSGSTYENVNIGPANARIDGAFVVENSPVGTVVGTVTHDDPNPGDTFAYTLIGDVDGLFAIDAGGIVTLAQPGRIDYEAKASYDFELRVVDSAGNGVQAAVTIAVGDGNETPVIDSNGGGDSAAVTLAENTQAVTLVHARDPDTATTLAYSISGSTGTDNADAARFTIDAQTGALSFAVAPDFDVPGDANQDNRYQVRVRASDGQLADEQSLTVQVTAVDEAPVIDSSGGGASAAISVAENNIAVVTLHATDPDAGSQVRYSLASDTDAGNVDAGRFAIDAVSGALVFSGNPDFEVPEDADRNNTYQVRVQASDGVSSDTQSLTVTVTDVTEALNLVAGNARANLLYGTVAPDLMKGEKGDDVLHGSAGADTLDGGAGSDTANYKFSGQGVQVFLAGAANGGDASGDTLISIENLVGSDSNDRLAGDANANELNGGVGADALSGGAGKDRFIYLQTAESTALAVDTILDFASGTDKIDLKAVDANTHKNNDQAFSWVSQFTGQAGELMVSYPAGGGATRLLGDTDGDRSADFVLELTGNVAFNLQQDLVL